MGKGTVPFSDSLLHRWQNHRLQNLAEVDAQCAATLALTPPNPRLADENLRGYVLLLSAHFQGFCRDLYSESAQIITVRVRKTLQLLIQSQFTANHRLDHGNPTLQNIKADFERFDFGLDLDAADPANGLRLQDLAALNRWRNSAAHQGNVPADAPLNLPLLRTWRDSCSGLATSLDGIMYNQLRKILRRAPWQP